METFPDDVETRSPRKAVGGEGRLPVELGQGPGGMHGTPGSLPVLSAFVVWRFGGVGNEQLRPIFKSLAPCHVLYVAS